MRITTIKVFSKRHFILFLIPVFFFILILGLGIALFVDKKATIAIEIICFSYLLTILYLVLIALFDTIQKKVRPHKDIKADENNKLFQTSLNNHIKKGFMTFKIIHIEIINCTSLELINDRQHPQKLGVILIDYLKKIYGNEIEVYELDLHSLTIILLRKEELKCTQDYFKAFFKMDILHKEPFPLLLKCGCSIYPNDDSDGNLLLLKAKIAANSIANNPGRYWCAYHPFLAKEISDETNIHLALWRAIEEKEITISYQPQIDIRNNGFAGFEALCRWNSLTLGVVSPATFIPVAQRYGHMPELDAYIIKQVFADYSRIKIQFPGASISINVSYYAMQADAFFTLVIEALKIYHVNPQHITFELTEDQPIFNKNKLIKQIQKFKKLGFKIALDDFGTGHNNLSHLFELPVDEVKIDSRFFRNNFEEKNKAIIKSIIALANSLNLKVIAEGIEQPEQKNFLLENNCFFIQGYLYYRPMKIDEILRI